MHTYSYFKTFCITWVTAPVPKYIISSWFSLHSYLSKKLISLFPLITHLSHSTAIMSLNSTVSYSKGGWYCKLHPHQTVIYFKKIKNKKKRERKKNKSIQLLTKSGPAPSRHLFQHVPRYVHYLSNNHLYKQLQSHLQNNYQKQKLRSSFKGIDSLTKKKCLPAD